MSGDQRTTYIATSYSQPLRLDRDESTVDNQRRAFGRVLLTMVIADLNVGKPLRTVCVVLLIVLGMMTQSLNATTPTAYTKTKIRPQP